MARYSQIKIADFFQQGDNAGTMADKGRALENLICYMFEKVPGIKVSRRNVMNTFETEEIDIAFWNDKKIKGFVFLPYLILVECKNWSNPVGTMEVSYFIHKLQNRGIDHGVLIAANGITGSSDEISRAHYEIAMALSKGLRIVIITREEINQLSTTENLVQLFKEKLCELTVSGTIFL